MLGAELSNGDRPTGRKLLEELCAEGAASRDQEGWRLKTTERLALAANSWFAGLPAAVRHDLLRAIRVRWCEPAEMIFRTGAPVRAWMVCLTGSVRVATSFSSGGRSLTLRYLRSGQWFGDLPVQRDQGHSHEASACGGTRVGEVDRQAVSALMDKHADFQGALLAWQSMRLASVYRLLEEQTTLSLSARMARHLHRLSKDHGVQQGDSEVRIALPLVQSDLAALIGCSRQRANEAVGELARRSMIRYEQGTLVVTDRRALECLAESRSV